ncbi:MAG: HDOD domain-containing protein, partial [Chromatiales bacterium]|nr:HDOD domain-containing protein [Chromatiales bacterium]
ASKVVANRIKVGSPGDLFIAGLLHDIGKLLLLTLKPIEYESALQEGQVGMDGCRIEERHFGFNHAELGADLLAEWGLPSSLVHTIRYHHDTGTDMLANHQAVINYADQMAHLEMNPNIDHNREEAVTGELATEARDLYQQLSAMIA